MKNLLLLFITATLAFVVQIESRAQEFAIFEDLVILPFDVTKWDALDSTILIVNYKQTLTDPERSGGPRSEEYTLQIGRKYSKYYSSNTNIMDEVESGLRDKGNRMVWYDGASLYCNLLEHKLTVVEREYFSKWEESGAYKYEEEVPQFEWEMTSDTLTILGHSCFKAKTSFRGRDWYVWFAPEVPMPIYPWKFNGLPGAILGFEDSKGVFSSRAIEISASKEPIKWFKWHYSETTREELNDYQRKVHDRPSLILLDGEPLYQISADGMGIANDPIPYQPMELE